MSVLTAFARRPAVPSDPAAAADYWMARRMLGGLSPRDELRFRDWLDESANARAWAEVDGLAEIVPQLAAAPEVLAMRDAALAVGPDRSPSRRAMAVAAAIVLSLAAGGTWFGQVPSGTASDRPAATAGAKRYQTHVGERREVRLDDGSVVGLNTDSLIEVAYGSGNRSVRLVRGQALFKVAHARDWPFVVTAGDRRVVAVGTEFDVRIQGDAVRVVLVEGRVRVEPLRPYGLARMAPALSAETLDAGQQLSAEIGDRAVIVEVADTDRATSWRHGQVIFRDDSLAAAAAEMNRYSDTRLVVTDPSVARLKVSGVFNANDPENFVAAVTAFLPVEASRTSPGVTELGPASAD